MIWQPTITIPHSTNIEDSHVEGLSLRNATLLAGFSFEVRRNPTGNDS